MAIYDKDAVAATAVAAWLSQYKVSANGDIRFVSGTDTFHTWWIHRALQKIAYDLAISGDDELNLSKPNPSTSEALGTIITLQNHTAAYSVNYNVTATEMEAHFGGSVTQNAGDDEWGGLRVLGAVASATQLQIIQNNLLLTSHWGTGKNQTASDVLLRIMVQTRSGGTDTDGKRLIVKANEWGDTFAVARTTLGLGEAVTAINTSSDPQNDTLQATVQGYTGITNTEGYQLLDIGDGSGDKPYLSQWDYGANDKKALYEWVKELMTRGTASTIYGVDGDFFTGGPTFSADLDTGGGGTWVQNEVVSWTEAGEPSTGILMAVDNLTDTSSTEMWVHILTGINPTDGTIISGTTASNAVDTVVTSLIPSFNHLGVFTGASWIGALGIGYDIGQLTSADSVQPLDGSGPLAPPNNVPIAVTVNGTVNSHVLLARATAGVVDQTQYTAAAGNNTSDPDFVINEAIDSDTPPSGFILVLEGTTFEAIEYASWAGSTFTLVGTLGSNYTAGKTVIVPIFYDLIATDGGSASTSLIYSSDIEVAGWVRHGEVGSPHKPVPIAGTIGTAGLSLTVTMESE